MYDFVEVKASSLPKTQGCFRCRLPWFYREVAGFNLAPGIRVTESESLTSFEKQGWQRLMREIGKDIMFR